MQDWWRSRLALVTLSGLSLVDCGGDDAPRNTDGTASGGSGGTQVTGGTGGAAGQGEPPVPESSRLVFPSLQLPGADKVTDFGFIPGTQDELLVLGHSGSVWHYRIEGDGESIETIGEAQIEELFVDEGCGLLSLTFDPEFESNRFVYISRCKEQTLTTIARFELDRIGDLPDTEVEIMVVEAPVADEDWHRFGSMGFEPDGETMWALLGDLFLRELAQDTSHKAGSILRFKPNRTQDGAGYEPATGNAFAEESDDDPTIFAYGLRSPWRGTRDRFGRFWVGDVGLVTREEVNLVREAGVNLGWDEYEGPCESACEGLTNPLTFYGRESDEPYVIDDPDTEPATKRAVWVGEAYHADQDRYFGFFDDHVVFGDFFTGWVRSLDVDEDGELVSDELVGHLTQVTSWKTGPDGYMYLVTLPGRLHRATLADL